MDRSQLRKLAAQYADGRIPAPQYRARRRALIDAIAGGTQPIERVSAPAAGAPAAAGAAQRGARKLPPLPLLLGGASALGLAVLATVLLWPQPEPPPAAPLLPAPPAPALPPARTLIESFVARRDFGSDALDALRRGWAALDEADRAWARSALWFRALVQTLRDEIRTQNALAELTAGGEALERARELRALGEELGIGTQLPGLEDPRPARRNPAQASAPPAPPPATAQQEDATAPQAAAPAAGATAAAGERASAPAAAPTPPAGAAPPAREQPPTGRQWLAARADHELTLQIFAVNHLDRVEELMAAHPELPLYVLASDGARPRYRVFVGVFADSAAAQAAFEALPGDVARAAGGAMVKSFAAVREDLAVPDGAAAGGAAVQRAAGSEAPYTLQLFASDSRASAESLLGAYPALALELREVAGDAAPYRVVYGRFASAREARAASGALPQSLLSRIGTPLARPAAQTGRPLAR